MSLDINIIELGFRLPNVVRHISQDVIDRFAVGSFDYNPIHVDPEWKRKMNLPGGESTIAHGQMTMSFMASALTDWACPDGGMVSRLDAKYIKPVLPGDIITAGGVVTEKHFHGSGNDFVTIEIFAENQKGERVAVGEADVILP
ncbi:MAG: MaoC family dehydratase [Burkholderiaceae bacterium]|nr:MaoC family dehydratase [Burkholderiaceae bacterium]